MTEYFRLDGKEKLLEQLRAVTPDVEAGVQNALKIVGDETRDQLRAQIQDGNGFAAEPGSAPHSQTGNLRKQIYSKLDMKTLGNEIVLTVGTSFKGFYGFILEYGASKYAKGFKRKHVKGEGLKNQARFGARLLPRPWFWSTVENFWGKAPKVVEKSIEETIKKYAS